MSSSVAKEQVISLSRPTILFSYRYTNIIGISQLTISQMSVHGRYYPSFFLRDRDAPAVVSRQLPPKENCPRLGLGFWARLGLVLGLGGNNTIALEKNCPLLRLGFGLGLVLVLVGNYPRTTYNNFFFIFFFFFLFLVFYFWDLHYMIFVFQ